MQPHKEQFDRDGYCVIRGFLGPQELQDMLGAVERFVAEVVPTMPAEHAYYEDKNRPDTLKQVGHMQDYDPFFAAFASSERLVGLAELLLDDDVVGKGLQWFNKPPSIGQETPPHQDGYFFMLEPNEALTMWLSLDTVGEANGCVRYLPGSHRTGMRPHGRTDVLGFSQAITDYGPDDFAAEVPMRTVPGDMIVHHSMTVHRADANRSDRTRKALGINFYSARAREDTERKNAYQRALDADLADAKKI